MVAALLTALTLGVIQLAVAGYVRNVIHDAAVEGAYHGALADTSPAIGAARAAEVITRAIGAGFADDVSARVAVVGGIEVVEVSVRAGIPLLGLWPSDLRTEVSANAPRESFDR